MAGATTLLASEPRCTTDAGALDALAKGCKRAADCEATEPHVFGIDSCVVVLRAACVKGKCVQKSGPGDFPSD